MTLHCREHKDQVFAPVNILTPSGSKYGFDTIAKVGCLRYQEHKQVDEIHERLKSQGLDIPRRTVHWLCDRFLEYVVAVHIESMPQIASLMARQGGYVLHIDGTGNKGRMVLLLKDGWSGIRLLATPVASEGAELVKPHLEYLKRHLGPPVAVIRDMSKGLEKAVGEVFRGTYVVVCHYHFLKDVGMHLFDKLYPGFRNRIDRRGVKKRLRRLRSGLRRSKKRTHDAILALEITEHILAFRKDGNGLAYPFSLPAVDFYRRCEEAASRVRKAILARAKGNKYSPILSKLEDILRLLKPPPAVLGRIHAEYQALGERWKWFERIRRVLRYRNGPIPLSTQVKLSRSELKKGRCKVDWVRKKIEEFIECGGNEYHERNLRRALRKVAKLIDKNREMLFAPNVSITVGKRKVTRRLPRTNAPVEMDYRAVRRHGRRIRGNSDVESQVQREGSGMHIVQNLAHKKYVREVYGSLHRMAERFSGVSPEALEQAKSLMGVKND